MKVQVGRVVASVDALKRLMAEKVLAATAFKLARITRQVETAVNDFEKVRISIVEKYGEKNDDGSVVVKPENVDAFQTEFSELVEQEITLDCEPLPLSALGDIQLTTADVLVLEYLLVD